MSSQPTAQRQTGAESHHQRQDLLTCHHCTELNAHTVALPSPAAHERMSGYTVHAGAVRESSGATGKQLNFRGNPEWYDFGACHVVTDGEGFCEVNKVGMRHVAVRTCGRESTYRPTVRRVCDALPRLASAERASRRSRILRLGPRTGRRRRPQTMRAEAATFGPSLKATVTAQPPARVPRCEERSETARAGASAAAAKDCATTQKQPQTPGLRRPRRGSRLPERLLRRRSCPPKASRDAPAALFSAAASPRPAKANACRRACQQATKVRAPGQPEQL